MNDQSVKCRDIKNTKIKVTSKNTDVPPVSGSEENIIDLLQQTPSSMLSLTTHQQCNEWMHWTTTYTHTHTYNMQNVRRQRTSIALYVSK